MAANNLSSTAVTTRLQDLPDQLDYMLELGNRMVPHRYLEKRGIDLECAICQDPYSASHRPVRAHRLDVPRSHRCVFGHTCLRRWAMEAKSCPLCRRDVYRGPVASESDEDDDLDLDSDEDDEPQLPSNEDDGFHPLADELLPALWTCVDDARSTSGPLWWADSDGTLSQESLPSRVLLERRRDQYHSGQLACSRTDYIAHERQVMDMYGGLPNRAAIVDKDQLLRVLDARYWSDLTGPRMRPVGRLFDGDDNDTGLANSWTQGAGPDTARLAPLAAHPLAYIAYRSMGSTVLDCSETRAINAHELEARLYNALDSLVDAEGRQLFEQVRRQSMPGALPTRLSDVLPSGFCAWVMDLIELVLMCHLGPEEAVGRRTRRGVGRERNPDGTVECMNGRICHW